MWFVFVKLTSFISIAIMVFMTLIRMHLKCSVYPLRSWSELNMKLIACWFRNGMLIYSRVTLCYLTSTLFRCTIVPQKQAVRKQECKIGLKLTGHAWRWVPTFLQLVVNVLLIVCWSINVHKYSFITIKSYEGKCSNEGIMKLNVISLLNIF